MSAPRKQATRKVRAASRCARIGFWLIVSALLIWGAAGFGGSASGDGSAWDRLAIADEHGSTETHSGMEVVQHGLYPELRVDGKPFFIHSAAFFYYRIPRDLWEPMLESYRRLGINTLDIYIPWNWHEPTEGGFDFDGHTNPRRDLRRLLGLISEKGFRLIARPGPEILNEWRYGVRTRWIPSIGWKDAMRRSTA
jgi:Glycosyl hydrolases family 35